jgi:hypothetical protein
MYATGFPNWKSGDEMVRPQIAVGDFKGYSVFWGLGWRIVKTAQNRACGAWREQSRLPMLLVGIIGAEVRLCNHGELR